MRILFLLFGFIFIYSHYSVIVGTLDGKMYCLNKSNGEVLFSVDTGGPLIKKDKNTKFIPSIDGGIFSLDRNGKLEVFIFFFFVIFFDNNTSKIT
jgi:hypothetical protein